jgi:hypothetical protein
MKLCTLHSTLLSLSLTLPLLLSACKEKTTPAPTPAPAPAPTPPAPVPAKQFPGTYTETTQTGDKFDQVLYEEKKGVNGGLHDLKAIAIFERTPDKTWGDGTEVLFKFSDRALLVEGDFHGLNLTNIGAHPLWPVPWPIVFTRVVRAGANGTTFAIVPDASNTQVEPISKSNLYYGFLFKASATGVTFYTIDSGSSGETKDLIDTSNPPQKYAIIKYDGGPKKWAVDTADYAKAPQAVKDAFKRAKELNDAPRH